MVVANQRTDLFDHPGQLAAQQCIVKFSREGTTLIGYPQGNKDALEIILP